MSCSSAVESPGMGHWGTCLPSSSLMHAKFCSRFLLVLIGLSRILKHWLLLLWQAVAKKNFSHIRFCRPDARWLSLLDDFVTTNIGTRAPVPAPGAKFWRRHCSSCFKFSCHFNCDTMYTTCYFFLA